MSAEAIIQQIKTDAEKEIESINKESKKTIQNIKKTIQQETDELKNTLLEKGKQEAENIKKIELSKANQEIKRQQLQKKESLIEQCFTLALERLKTLDETQYKTIITTLITKGKKQIKGPFSIHSSKPIDKTIAKHHKIPVSGSIDASGGIKLISDKDKVSIDNTFEGILKRKKQDIRIQVGTILFPK